MISENSQALSEYINGTYPDRINLSVKDRILDLKK